MVAIITDDAAHTPLRTLAALLTGQTSPDAVNAADWPAIVDLAVYHRVAPLLLAALSEHKIDLTLPVWEPLAAFARDTALQFMLRDRAQRAINAALLAAGITPLWFKGSALAYSIYPDPAMRSMTDLDVLVPEDHHKKALEIIQSLGYRPPDAHKNLVSEAGSEIYMHDTLIGGAGDLIMVELHHRLLGPDGQKLLPPSQLAWLMGQTTMLDADGAQFTVLKPEAHLLYLCAHAILQHGEGAFDLLRYLDMHLLITHDAIDWQIIVEKAVELRWSYAVERALTLTQEYFATPVPCTVLPLLRERRSPDEDVNRVRRLQGDSGEWEYFQLATSQLSLRKRLRFSLDILVPNHEYLRKRYPSLKAQPIAFLYLYRWSRQLSAILRAASRTWKTRR